MQLSTVLIDALDPVLARLPEGDLELVVELVVLIAAADRKIDPAERDALRAALEKIVGSRLSPIAVQTLIAGALTRFRAAGGEAYARQVGKELAARGAAEHGYRVAAVVALASEDISPEEKNYLVIYAEAAGISRERRLALEAELERALATR
ncbi:MAG: TerB family tellurite resistance protein [Polyangiaceae bacterium]|nr:TerB family tellurite resistance protein [Polyangiaceae bacterium]